MFACCDHFNKGLHDKVWPHKRGGCGHTGAQGKINDFIMAVMLQNTYNAWHEITGTPPHDLSFKKFCCTLADQLWNIKCNDASLHLIFQSWSAKVQQNFLNDKSWGGVPVISCQALYVFCNITAIIKSLILPWAPVCPHPPRLCGHTLSWSPLLKWSQHANIVL